MKHDSIKLVLPIPPTLNGLYKNARKGRVKSEKYKNWESEALGKLITQTTYKITGNSWLEVRYIYFMSIYTKTKNKRVLDVFNREKALSDFLEANIEGFEDHKIRKGFVEKIDSPLNEVHITIKEIN